MFEQQIQEVILLMVYASVTVISLIACCYLLFRRANAIAPDITSPVRLRRWTAAFFASLALGHLWYLPTYFLSSDDDVKLCNLIGGLLDAMTAFPLAIVILFCMLQDRKRPLWPIALMVAPLVAGMAWGVFIHSDTLMPILRIYFLLMGIGLLIYMVHATRQYGRWLRDNFADLEHKEVWQSFVVLVLIFVLSNFYVGGVELPVYEYVLQISGGVLICYLLWRVETLSELSLSQQESLSTDLSIADTYDHSTLGALSAKNIEALLQQHCIDTQLYLQHDLTIIQLAKAVGTNRFYLSQYFTSLGINYNAYINDLRINHFISLHQEAVATNRVFTVQQLAQESGYHSYSTFCSVIKRKTGKSVTAWIKVAVPPKL